MPKISKPTGPRSTLSTLRKPILGDDKENAAVRRNEHNVKNVAVAATGLHDREPLRSLQKGKQSLLEASTKTTQNIHVPGIENRGSATTSSNNGRSEHDPEGVSLARVQTAATAITKTAIATNSDGQARAQPQARAQTQSRIPFRSRLADLPLKMQAPGTEKIQVYQQQPSTSSSSPGHITQCETEKRALLRTAATSKRTTTGTAITTSRVDSTTSASLQTVNSTINRPASHRGREAVEKLARRTVTFHNVNNTRSSAAATEQPAASVNQAPCKRNARENQPPIPHPSRPEALGVIENKKPRTTAKTTALNKAVSVATKPADGATVPKELDVRLLASLFAIPFEIDDRAARTCECLWRRREQFEAVIEGKNEEKVGVAKASSLAAPGQKQQHLYITQEVQRPAVQDSYNRTEEGDDDDGNIEWVPVVVPVQEGREVAEEYEIVENSLPAQEGERHLEKRRKIDMAEVEQMRQDFYDYSPQLVREYAEEAFSYKRTMELLLAPDLKVVDNLSNDALNTRIDLIQLIIELCVCMSSPGETLFLAVHILDRVITRRMHYPERSNRLHRDHRVIGLVCLMIAGKYEEMTNHNYRLLMFLHIAKGLKLQGEIDVGILQRNERDVLKILDYRLGWPGPLSFLRRCSRADEGDQFARTGAKFVLELMMLDIRFLHYMPSLQAAAAIFVARFALGRTAWNSSMAQYSGYEAKDIDPVVHDIVMLLREEEASDTFPYYKYCTRVNYRISKFMLNWAQRLKNLDLLQQLYREETKHQEEEDHEEYYECEEYDEWMEQE